MVATPLSQSQQLAVGALVAAKRIEPVPVDSARASAFMTSARRLLEQVALLDYPEAQHTLASNACHAIAEAMLAGYGYRTKSGSGQHEALGRFLCAVIDTPPADAAAIARGVV